MLTKDFYSDPSSASKIDRLGGWGWKNDPDVWDLSSTCKLRKSTVLAFPAGALL